jgi:hypothetical protein
VTSDPSVPIHDFFCLVLEYQTLSLFTLRTSRICPLLSLFAISHSAHFFSEVKNISEAD